MAACIVQASEQGKAGEAGAGAPTPKASERGDEAVSQDCLVTLRTAKRGGGGLQGGASSFGKLQYDVQGIGSTNMRCGYQCPQSTQTSNKLFKWLNYEEILLHQALIAHSVCNTFWRGLLPLPSLCSQDTFAATPERKPVATAERAKLHSWDSRATKTGNPALCSLDPTR